MRVRDGRAITTDGPFAETKEQLAGFYKLDARDLNEAARLAEKIPPARYGSVEIRPVRELLPPQNLSVAEVARQEGISDETLYAWRKQVKAEGAVVPGDKKLPDDWPAEVKFAVVLENAALSLSEIELSEYCRRKGLYPEQVNAWRQAWRIPGTVYLFPNSSMSDPYR